MKTNINPTLVANIIRNSGVVAVERPSISHPIAVNLLYWNNPDGTIRLIWPKGNVRPDVSRLLNIASVKSKWAAKMFTLFFALGWGSMLSHGRLVLYTDVPTATFLQNQWQMN